MARMNLRTRRDAPGVSVFWMILAVGAGVFVLVGLVLFTVDSETRIESAEPDIIAGEGDEPPGTTSFSEGEVAESPSPPDIPGEADEVDESVPETGEADDSAEARTAIPIDADPAEAPPDDAMPGSEAEGEGEEPAGTATGGEGEEPAGTEAGQETEGEAEAEQPEAEEPAGADAEEPDDTGVFDELQE